MRTLVAVIKDALGQLLGRPRLLIVVYLANVVLALPLAVAMDAVLADSIGDGIYQETMLEQLDAAWYGEHRGRHAEGLGATFTPSKVLGAGAMLDNLDAWLEGGVLEESPAILPMALLWAVVWLGLQGAVLDRFIHGGAAGIGSFTGAAGRHLGRMTQLAGLGVFLYWGLWSIAGELVTWIDRRSLDVNQESEMLARLLPVVIGLVLLFHLVRLVIDYAKVAAVTDTPTIAVPALANALVMLGRRGGVAVGAYLLTGLAMAAWMVLFFLLAPSGAGGGLGRFVLAVGSTQLFVFGRLTLRLLQLAAAVQVYGRVERA